MRRADDRPRPTAANQLAVPRIDVIQANRPATGVLSPDREMAIRGAGLSGARIVIRIPKAGPTSIIGAYEDALAAPQVLTEVVKAEEEGADAVVINCTADTGVDGAREAVAIPVVGVAEAAFHLAAQLADRFAVLTFNARTARRFRSMAARYGMSDRLSGIRSVEIALEKLPDSETLAIELERAAVLAVKEDGAEAIILSCTDFELAAAPTRERLRASGVDVPLLKPFEIGLHQAESLIAMGLAHSKLTFKAPDGRDTSPSRRQ